MPERHFFAPIRTETFKAQLKVLEELFGFLQDKDESALIKLFDEHSVVEINTFDMIYAYVETCLPNQIQMDNAIMTEMRKRHIGAIMSKDYLEKHFSLVGDFDESTETMGSTEKTELDWKQYQYGSVAFTKEYQININQLKRISLSPLLPPSVKRNLDALQSLCNDNLLLVGVVLTDVAGEMPALCPNGDKIIQLNPNFAWNRYNHRRQLLEPAVLDILRSVRDYLHVDNLLA